MKPIYAITAIAPKAAKTAIAQIRPKTKKNPAKTPITATTRVAITAITA